MFSCLDASAYAFGLPDLVDENGATGEMYHNWIDNEIDKLYESDIYFFWSPIMYNFATTVVHMLNNTETVLQSRNETLADWFTNGRNHKERGEEFVQIFKDQFFSKQVKTQSGPLRWDREENSILPDPTGYILGILQVQRNKSSPTGYSRVPVFTLTYDASDKPVFTYLDKNIKWRTLDRKPHRSSTEQRSEQRNVANVAVASGLKSISAMLIFCLLVIALYTAWIQHSKTSQPKEKQYGTGPASLLHCIGMGVVLLFVLLMPAEMSGNMAKMCQASLICFITGEILVVGSVTCRLYLFSRAFADEQKATGASKKRKQSQQPVSQLPKSKFGRWFLLIAVIFTVIAMILSIVWLHFEPIEIIEEEIGPIKDEMDNSIERIYITPTCTISMASNIGLAAMAIVILILCSLLVSILQISFNFTKIDAYFKSNNALRVNTNRIVLKQLWSMSINYLTLNAAILLAALIISTAIFKLTTERGYLTLSIALNIQAIVTVIMFLIAFKNTRSPTTIPINPAGSRAPSTSNTLNSKNGRSKPQLSVN